MPKLALYWSETSKLKRTRTASFGLPAFRARDGFRVCPGAGGCAALCYARQGRYLWPESVAAREFNLQIARSDLATFELLAVHDLERMRERSIRVHDSGDYFDQPYVDAWFRIAARFPRKRFYSYTKSLTLDFSGAPPNFRIVQSCGGKHDARIDRRKPHTRIFPTRGELRAAGYCDGSHTDRAAQGGQVVRIGFVYHGSVPLSLALAKYLRDDFKKGGE